MATGKSIVWFRRDLRLADNPALEAAIRHGGGIVPVYVWAPEEEGAWVPGGASRWWLHHALGDLDRQLHELGSRLVIINAAGRSSLKVLQQLARDAEADAIYWNRRYEPAAVQRDTQIKTALRERDLDAQSFNGSLLFDPPQVENKSGAPFKVFTPFWKHLLTLDLAKPAKPDLRSLKPAPQLDPELGDDLGQLELLPSIAWDQGFAPFWGGEPSRSLVEKRLRSFVRRGADAYPDTRDTPAVDGTSMLSPFLHFGQVGPRELWWRFANAANHTPNFDSGVMRQLVWREFSHHLLYHFPETSERPLRPEFERFPWRADEAALERWQRGQTGYPIVDAGMRQLWQTGWMHNRVRMVVASFLVKHLLIAWQDGARWFWDTLVDADLANNTMGWQWTAGCGADAAPYFRIFNPIAQGQKFDPGGEYVRRYVPELSDIPDKHIHSPWELGALELAGYGITLDRDYPAPMIDHRFARQRALDAFASLKDQ